MFVVADWMERYRVPNYALVVSWYGVTECFIMVN